MPSTSQLEVYNCTPRLIAVQINTILNGFQVDGDDDASQGYYPYSNTNTSSPANVPRVLTNPQDRDWTRVNTLTIGFDGLAGQCVYTNLADPPNAAFPANLRLWIFEQFIALSQGDHCFCIVKPDPQP